MEPSYMIEKAELFTFENSYTIPFDMSGNKDKKGYKSIQLLPVDPNDYPGKEMTDRERTLFKGRLNSKLFAIFGKCADNGGIDKIYCAELIRGIYWRNKFYGMPYANYSRIEIEKSRQIDVFSEMLDGLFTTVDFLAIVRGEAPEFFVPDSEKGCGFYLDGVFYSFKDIIGEKEKEA